MNSQSRDFRRSSALGPPYLAQLAGFGLAVAVLIGARRKPFFKRSGRWTVADREWIVRIPEREITERTLRDCEMGWYRRKRNEWRRSCHHARSGLGISGCCQNGDDDAGGEQASKGLEHRVKLHWLMCRIAGRT